MPTLTIPQALEVAMRQQQAGQLAEAERIYRQILQVQPREPDALRLLGLLAYTVGKAVEALPLLEAAIAVNPQVAIYHSDRGNALLALGRAPEAEAAFRRALQLDPELHVAWSNLGNALQAQGQRDTALECYRAALARAPDFAQAHNNVGTLFYERGELAAAIEAYQTALRLQPTYAEAARNLGNAFRLQGNGSAALEALRRSAELAPRQADTENSLGLLHMYLGQTDSAAAAFRRTVELQPTHADGSSNLGSSLAEQGDLDAAISCWRTALARHPERLRMHSNLVFVLPFHPGYDAPAILREARDWDRQHGAPLWPATLRPRRSLAGRRLRVGYVSPNFSDHVVGRNLLPLLREHDRGRFELFCYSGAAVPDKLTARFRQYADHWQDTYGRPDEQLAELILRDELDVLIDTALHMEGGRLGVFARKLAPVQVTFAGYPGTTGLRAMDFRLTDPHLDPPGETDADYSERSLRLADSFWCYEPLETDLAVGPLPATARGHITFGCLNHPRKTNDSVIALWSRVLAAVPGSTFLLLSSLGSSQIRITASFARHGIDPARIRFVSKGPRREYLALYDQIDVVLDTLPYNGHTTSLDALWMGAPVVTRPGPTVVSRAGLSQLRNLGLPELIAHSDDEFVSIASALATDLPGLASLRASLRPRMEASPLMDAKRFARSVEAALLEAAARNADPFVAATTIPVL
jgi:protein O-GlcNAc transferase